jgi:FkbM family methyltransferase
VRAYVAWKEIFDVGAYRGDSLLVLEEYTNVRVRSFELIPNSAVAARRQASQANHSKHVVHNMGLSDMQQNVTVPQSGGIGSGLYSRGSVHVPVSTIDHEVDSQNLSVGFIKIDVEGAELPILQGGIHTLKSQHPILSLSSYHNIELMDIPVFLEKVGGYRVEFDNQGVSSGNLYEQVILAYPEWMPGDYHRRPLEA